MPGKARGRTIQRIVCHFEAPQARLPSRIERGTAASASSGLADILLEIELLADNVIKATEAYEGFLKA